MSRPGRILHLAILLASTLLAGAGCGYHSILPGASSPANSADVPTVEGDRGGSDSRSVADALSLADSRRDVARPVRLAVMAIRNDSPEPWLDRILADALRREMELRAGLALVNDPERAEWLLRGRIRPLLTQSNSFSSFVAAIEYSVRMDLDLELVREGGLVVRLDSQTLSETVLYLASADIEITRTNRLEALRHLSDVLASRVADTIEMMEAPMPAVSARTPPAGQAQQSTPPAGEGR